MICIETDIHKQKNKIKASVFCSCIQLKCRFFEPPRKINISLKIRGPVQLRERNRLLVRVCERFKNVGLHFYWMEERLILAVWLLFTPLSVKTSPGAKSFIPMFIFMQIKVVFIRMVSYLDSLWSRDTRELANGLFLFDTQTKTAPYASTKLMI